MNYWPEPSDGVADSEGEGDGEASSVAAFFFGEALGDASLFFLVDVALELLVPVPLFFAVEVLDVFFVVAAVDECVVVVAAVSSL